jgi:hypothetical protein
VGSRRVRRSLCYLAWQVGIADAESHSISGVEARRMTLAALVTRRRALDFDARAHANFVGEHETSSATCDDFSALRCYLIDADP